MLETSHCFGKFSEWHSNSNNKKAACSCSLTIKRTLLIERLLNQLLYLEGDILTPHLAIFTSQYPLSSRIDARTVAQFRGIITISD
jgi:hypothetical protein